MNMLLARKQARKRRAERGPRQLLRGVGPAGSNSDDFNRRMRLRNLLAMFAKTFDVKFDCFANELLRFVSRFTNRNTPWKIGNVRSDA